MTDNGVTFADPTPQELAQWREVMKPVYQNQPGTSASASDRSKLSLVIK